MAAFDDRSLERQSLANAARFAAVPEAAVGRAIADGDLEDPPTRAEVAAWIERNRAFDRTDELAREWSTQGFVHARGVLGEAEREALSAACDALLEWTDREPDHPTVVRQEGGVLERLREADTRSDVVRRLAYTPFAARVARAIVGGPAVVYGMTLMVKLPHLGVGIPLHRDPTWTTRAGPDPVLTIGFYLDDAPPGSGEVRFFPGSHRRAAPVPEGPGIALDVRAGDAVVHNLGVLHGSAPNRTPRLRRTLYCSLMSRREAENRFTPEELSRRPAVGAE